MDRNAERARERPFGTGKFHVRVGDRELPARRIAQRTRRTISGLVGRECRGIGQLAVGAAARRIRTLLGVEVSGGAFGVRADWRWSMHRFPRVNAGHEAQRKSDRRCDATRRRSECVGFRHDAESSGIAPSKPIARVLQNSGFAAHIRVSFATRLPHLPRVALDGPTTQHKENAMRHAHLHNEKWFSIAAWLAVGLLTVPVAATAVTLAAGRTPGEFGVTHSGAATYRIPLWTPPGVADVDLDLALVYNSRAGNGVLGPGWALAGLSAISRCNRTVAQDGIAAGVRNTSADRFCLDGQQLKLVSGDYGAAESVYATEIESFARTVATGVSGSGPLSFRVTSKNGLVYEYGSTADSRINAGSTETVRTWALSSVRDRVGNSMALSYFNDGQAAAYTNGTYRIATITYPRTATGSGPFYEVRFSYSARALSDVPVGYLAGNVLREPNKLDSITVQAVGSSTPIKSYNLSYDVSAATGRIRLVGIQECAASSCFRPTTVTYQAGPRRLVDLARVGRGGLAQAGAGVADFDGDGLTDLLYPVNSGSSALSWWIARATVDGFATPFPTGLYTPTSASKVVYGDFLGNGRTQFLVQQGGVWSIAGYSGNAFTVASTGLAAAGEYGAADIDGDGLADLVAGRRRRRRPSSFVATRRRRHRAASLPGSHLRHRPSGPCRARACCCHGTTRAWPT